MVTGMIRYFAKKPEGPLEEAVNVIPGWVRTRGIWSKSKT